MKRSGLESGNHLRQGEEMVCEEKAVVVSGPHFVEGKIVSLAFSICRCISRGTGMDVCTL